MRKGLLILAVAVLAVLQTAWAYDFSATSPSGHTLYYEIIIGTTNVGVVRPGTGSTYDNYVTGNVVIPATVTYGGTTYNVTELRSVNYSYGTFLNCSGLTSVTIPNSVTSIGYSAFSGCKGLTSVTIPNSLTTIGRSAFERCSGLTSVTIPNSVTTIGNLAFDNCSGLTSVTIGNSVTSIGYSAFSGCTGLTSVTIPNSVTTIGNNAFYMVRHIIYNGTATGSPWGALSHNSVVEDGFFKDGFVYTDNTKTSLLRYIGTNTNVIIPNSVTTIGRYAFDGCTGLTSVTIPNSVTSIEEYAFYDCSGLTSVTIPNSVTSIGYSAFYNCNSLTTLNFNAINCNNFITSIFPYSYCPFENCPISTINIGDSVQRIPADFACNLESLTSVTIPASVISIGNYAFSRCSGLTSVTIPNSVTTIGNSAFSSCTGLTSVTIPNSVTSIGSSAFSGCSGLTSVTIPNSVTTIGNSAFAVCTGLTSVTIPNSVTSIENNAFYMVRHIIYNGTATGSPWGALSYNGFVEDGFIYADSTKTSLLAYIGTSTSVTIPNSVTSIGSSAFRGCSGLTSVTIPNSVTAIGDRAFDNCRGLTSVTIGNSVTSIGERAFEFCNGLTSVTIPNSVTSIGQYAFNSCTGLTSVTIPNSVTTIGTGAFAGCTGLTSVTIPNSVTSIGQYAFNSCTGLTSVTIPNSVTSIGNFAFDGCKGLTTLNFNAINCGDFSSSYPFYNCPISTINIGDSVQRIPANFIFPIYCSLTSVTIPNSVTTIGNSAFKYCRGLTSVTIGNSVTSIGEDAFAYCTGLTSVTIPDSVTSIGENAFYNVKHIIYNGTATGSPWGALSHNGFVEDGFVYADSTKTSLLAYIGSDTNVVIPNSVTTIGRYAFAYCYGLTSVTIPDSVTTIGENAFYDVEHIIYNGTATGSPWGALSHNGFVEDGFVYADSTKTSLLAYIGSDTNVVIPNSVTSIGDLAFYGCSGLTSVTIPNSVSTIGDWAFYNCRGLTSVTIGNSVTTIGGAAFSGCTGLTSVTIGNSVTFIGDEAFSNCSGLTSVTIPNSVTFIGDEAFSNCSGLTSVTIPNSVTSIKYSAFSGCNNLHEVISLAVTPPSLESYVFSAAGILKVPCGSENSYSSNASWSQYFDDIKEMCNLTITVTSVNDSMGIVLGGGEYDFGSPATIAAIPNSGYQFYQWNDGDVTNPRSLAVLSDSSFIATFSAISIGEEVHDTLYVDRYIYDTITNTVHDTTYVPVHDTTYITQIDTVTNTVYDTITNTVYDTIDNFVYDTVYITETDTLWLFDTIYMHDTIYIYDTMYIRDSTTGIEDVSVINAKIYSSHSRIVVEGAEGNSVMLFDMQGRLLSTKQDEYSVLEFEVPISGAYFVKIGNYKAKKVVVIK